MEACRGRAFLISDLQMKLRQIIRKVIFAWLLLIPSGLVGHSDPRGEVQPLVRVEDGCFVIYTWEYGSEHSYSPVRRTIYSPEGRILNPSKIVTDSKLLESLKSDEPMAGVNAPRPAVWIELDPVEDLSAQNPNIDPFANGSLVVHHGFYLSMWRENQKTKTRLPLKNEGATGLEATLVREKELGLVWGKLSPKVDGSAHNVELMFAWIERSALRTICEISLGECAAIYDFAVVSNIIWTGDRAWLAWVRKASDSENLPPTKQWITVLASIDPSTGTVKEEPLNAQSHWNAHLSMNVCDGWLCLAWHCPKHGMYPDDAQIVTEFRKLK